MLRSTFFLILILAGSFIASCNKNDAYDYHNKPIKLSDYRGKWVVVNYWATWCQPCFKEFPELNQVYSIAKNKVVVLGISYDRLSNQELAKTAEKFGITFPLLSTFPLEKFAIQEISTVPVTFLISPAGKLAKTLYGPQTSTSLLADMDLDQNGKESSR